MPSRNNYSNGYSSSSASSRSSSSSSAALARELGGLSINSKKGNLLHIPSISTRNTNTSTAPSYDPKHSSQLQPRYAEPERQTSSKHTSSRYETTLITPDTSRSRPSKSSYDEPSVRYVGEPCRDPKSSKTDDSRYHANSFNDARCSSNREDSRFYPKSAYYERRQ